MRQSKLTRRGRRASTPAGSPDAALLISDAKGVILYVHRKFTRYSGFNAAEALGRTPRIRIIGKTHTALHQATWATIRGSRPWRGRLLVATRVRVAGGRGGA